MLRSLRRSLISLAVLSALVARGAAAQTPPAAAPQPAAPQAAQPQAQRTFVKVVMKSGQEYEGWVVSQTADTLVLDLSGGGQMTMPMSSVASITERKDVTVRAGGEVWPEDRNRTRYLMAPSAFMLRAGEGYFSQKELLFSEVGYGVTDWLTLSIGGAIPLWFVSDGFNLIGGLKVGVGLGEILHVSAGGSIWWIPGADPAVTFGLVTGTVTIGTPNLHLSLAASFPYTLQSGAEDVGDMILIVAGNWRLSRTLALVTENWIFMNSTAWDVTTPMINSLVLRIFGDRIAVDLGLLVVPETSFPPPWLAFTYNFGG
ncbi:MAG TPA: hypothetical protein VFR85_17760 [Anaeromyxobacteraceae bacterium]|nr:hypothetical protein [Anaeromyxobacteraceae bacterium]